MAQDRHARREDVVEGEGKWTRSSYQRLGRLAGEKTVVGRGVDEALRRRGGDGRGRRRDVAATSIANVIVAAVDGREGVVSGLPDDYAGIDGRSGDNGADGLLQERRRACATEKGGEKRGRPMRREFGAGHRMDDSVATTAMDRLFPAIRLSTIEAFLE